MPAKKKTVKKKATKKATRKKSTKKKVTRKKAAASKVPAAKSRKRSKSAARRTSAKATRQQKKQGTVKKTVAGLARPSFPIVGIGASAGGLEAMTDFLKDLPADIGMAFVLVQHLAPEHKSMMVELLAQETTLRVSEVKDGMVVEPNNLYVIPPNTNLGIINNTLHLMPRVTQKQHLPIDYFLQSLAKDQGSNAIGIILSGSASDGTLGLKAIKAEEGITFAQDKETARYDSMPSSAIAAGCVDFVLSPKDVAHELIHIARHPDVLRVDATVNKKELEHSNKDLDKIFLLLRNRTGNDFTYYKHNTIRRRISRRMLVHKIDRLKDYVRYLSSHPVEVDALFHDILINVTGFFRDPEVFDSLKNDVFPAIMEDHKNDHPIRIWGPGCSSGEEVYSIIISLLEYLGDNARGVMIQVFASDIDEQAIEQARIGIYPEGISADVSRERLHRFFTKVPQGYQINKRIRDLCVFAQQNITKDPPFSHQDLIVCRNMLIYMGNVLQRKVLQTLHYALKPDGYLLLGSAETVGASADLFSTALAEHKVYKKKDLPLGIHYQPAITPHAHTLPSLRTEKTFTEQQPMDLQKAAESLIINQYGPPGVVVNDRLDVMQFVGHTGPYLAPAPGAASLNLIKLAHPDLTVELRVTIHKAIRENKRIRKEGIRLRHNSLLQEVTIEIVPLLGSGDGEQYFLVLFLREFEYEAKNIAKEKASKKELTTKEVNRIQELEQELETNKTYMQTIIEEQEASNEELQSANEEIQSTNEELQSTNEELETAKEELQSTNEELITVNEELENRNVELSTSNDDLNNLIASTDLPLLMLNSALSIRFFSSRAKQLLNLIDADIGRPIGDIRPNVDVDDLAEHVQKVLETLKPLALEVSDGNQQWYTMHIRPYRTEDNRIQGAIIVFFDITDSKILQRASRLATVVEDSNDAITLQDFDGRILAWNRRSEEVYGYKEEDIIGENIDLVVPEEYRMEMKTCTDNLKLGRLVRPFETVRQKKSGETIKVLVTMSLLRDERGRPEAIATTEHLLTD